MPDSSCDGNELEWLARLLFDGDCGRTSKLMADALNFFRDYLDSIVLPYDRDGISHSKKFDWDRVIEQAVGLSMPGGRAGWTALAIVFHIFLMVKKLNRVANGLLVLVRAVVFAGIVGGCVYFWAWAVKSGGCSNAKGIAIDPFALLYATDNVGNVEKTNAIIVSTFYLLAAWYCRARIVREIVISVPYLIIIAVAASLWM